MSTNGFDEVSGLAAAYVLGTLSFAGRERVERRLAAEPGLRAEVDFWQEALLPLTSLVEPVEPSARLWRRIEGSLSAVGAGGVKPVAGARLRDWWSDLRFWQGLAAGALAAVAVLSAVLLNQLPAGPAPAQYMVVLVAPGGNAPGWLVRAGNNRQLSLVPLGTGEVPQGKSLQFWTKADSWSAPVSLGLVPPGKPMQVSLEKLPPLESNQLFELTLEPLEGSPTGRPTGPIQYIGRAVPLM